MIHPVLHLRVRQREEIINACEQLYRTMNFREITLKEIGGITSFSRPTIYNYFETKEEIFLAIFQQEYEKWAEQLNAFIAEGGQKSKSEVAEMIASSLEERPLMLKLLSMNLFHMEEKSREERLVEFKVAFGNSFKAVDGILQTYCPEMDDNARQAFLYAFFPFIYGLYPYTNVTEKQKSAMIEAGIDYAYYSVHDLAYNCLIKLLK